MKNPKTKVTYQEVSVDHETGEVKKHKKTLKSEREPDFVKLYLRDLALLSELPKWLSGVLYELLQYMNYDNEIILNSTVKKRIAEKLDIQVRSISNALSKFVKKNILIKNGRGTYIANPYIFGRGSWSNIKEIRMNIHYLKDKKTISSEITTEEEDK